MYKSRVGLSVSLLSSTTLATSRGLRPALSLNFLSGTLDPRITFSRSSQAAVVDSTGKITYAPNNLLLRSQEFDVAPWQATNAGTGTQTISANGGLSPIGDLTADRLQLDLNGGTTSNDATRRRQAVTVSGGNYTFSVWLRSFDGVSTYTVGIQLASTVSAVTVTGEWQRFYITVTLAAGSVASDIFIRGAQTPTHSPSADLLVWGAQLEAVTYQTTPGTYNATTTAAYYGPRFDYDPVTLAAKGLLVEEQRSNLLTYSEQFDNAAWIKTNATVTANTIVSPDGTANADKIVENTATGAHAVGNSAGTVSATETLSIYVKPAERTWIALQLGAGVVAYYDVQNGVLGSVIGGTATITAVGNGWYRCTATGVRITNTNNLVYVASANNAISYAGDGTSGLYIWGAQLEAGSFATSYIPTVASQVTRTADVATITGANFSQWYNQSEGTFVVAQSPVGDANGAKYYFATNDGTASNYVAAFGSLAGRASTVGGVVQAEFDWADQRTIGAIYKSAIAYKANDFAACVGGGTVLTDTSGTLPTVNQAMIGDLEPGANRRINGHIRSIAYYPTRLANSQLQALTS